MLCTLKKENADAFIAPYAADEGSCPVDWAKRTIAAFRERLCGRSLFCREGMAELYRLAEDISEGKGKPEDLELIKELCDGMRQMADCDTAKAISTNLAAALENSAEVWEMHIRRKRCTALSCDKLLTFYIDAVKCNGCGKCSKECPVDAIEGGEGLYHIIRLEDCVKCGRCVPVCQTGAVTKAAAGAVLPRMPEKPDAVGSFKGGLGGLKRGLRGKPIT